MLVAWVGRACVLSEPQRHRAPSPLAGGLGARGRFWRGVAPRRGTPESASGCVAALFEAREVAVVKREDRPWELLAGVGVRGR